MGLLIKDNSADFSNVIGAEKYYLDALTTEGTLLLHDYSRGGCLPSKTLKNGVRVVDLAQGGTELDNNSNFVVNSIAFKNDDYLESGAMRMKNMMGDGLPGGVNLGTKIQEYLVDNNVQKLLMILWAYVPYDPQSYERSHPIIQASTSEDIGTGNLIRVYLNASWQLTVTLAGVSARGVAVHNPDGVFNQVAVVYERGEVLKTYRNNAKVNSDSLEVNNNVWGEPDSDLIVGVNANDGVVSRNKLGRLLIEDLDRSGRDPVDVINMDYTYVNATGDFAGIEKRPYANL